MRSKLPLLPSGPGGVRKSTFHGPWHAQCAAAAPGLQAKTEIENARGQGRLSKSAKSLFRPLAALLAVKGHRMTADDQELNAAGVQALQRLFEVLG
jgi:hypothetical protein